MDVATVTAVVGTGVTVIGAVIVTARYAAAHLRSLTRQMAELRDDWYGEAARPGFDARPGLPERLQRIERELTSNGGSSTRDAISRVELDVKRQALDLTMLGRRLDQHLQQVAPAIAELVEWRRQQQIEGVQPDEDPGAGR